MAQYKFTPEAKAQHEDFVKRGQQLQAKHDKATGDAKLGAKQDLMTHMERHKRFLAKYEVKGGAAPAPSATNGGQEKRVAPRAIKLDTAAEDADEVESRQRAASGKAAKGLDLAAIKAADADKSWAGKSVEEQQAAAKAAHTTETPGASHETSVGTALRTAQHAAAIKGGKAEAERMPQQEDKSLAHQDLSQPPRRTGPSGPPPGSAPFVPSREVSDRNNMGAPKADPDASIVAGRTGNESQAERDRARAAARGAGRSGNKAAEAAAAQKSRRSSPVSKPAVAVEEPTNTLFSGHQMTLARGHAHMITGGQEFPSEKLSDKPAAPAANPAPKAPTPATAAPSGGGAFDAQRIKSRFFSGPAPAGNGAVETPKPRMGKDITYGAMSDKGGAANTRAAYQRHIAGGGTDESYWTERDAKKAARTANPAGATNTAPAPVSAPATSTPAAKVDKPPVSAGTPAPVRTPTPAVTGLNPAQASKAAAPQAPAAPARPTNAARPVAEPRPAPASNPAPKAPAPVSPGRVEGPSEDIAAPSVGGRGPASSRLQSSARGGLHVEGNEGSIRGGIGNVNQNHYGDVVHDNSVHNHITVHGDNNGSISVGGGSAGRGGNGGPRAPRSGDSGKGEGDERGYLRVKINKNEFDTRDVGDAINKFRGEQPEESQGSTGHMNSAQFAGVRNASRQAEQSQPGYTGTTNNQQLKHVAVNQSASGNGTASKP